MFSLQTCLRQSGVSPGQLIRAAGVRLPSGVRVDATDKERSGVISAVDDLTLRGVHSPVVVVVSVLRLLRCRLQTSQCRGSRQADGSTLS
jgi:hypothetical protein